MSNRHCLICSRNRGRYSKNCFCLTFCLDLLYQPIFHVFGQFSCRRLFPGNTEGGHRPIYHAPGSSSLTFVEAHNVLPTPGGVNVRPRSQIFLLSRRLYYCPSSWVSLASQVCTWICLSWSLLDPNGSLIPALYGAPVSWVRMNRVV